MSKTPTKPADAPAPAAVPVPTHGGVYVNEGGTLKAIEGGPPPVAPTPAVDTGPTETGAA